MPLFFDFPPAFDEDLELLPEPDVFFEEAEVARDLEDPFPDFDAERELLPAFEPPDLDDLEDPPEPEERDELPDFDEPLADLDERDEPPDLDADRELPLFDEEDPPVRDEPAFEPDDLRPDDDFEDFDDEELFEDLLDDEPDFDPEDFDERDPEPDDFDELDFEPEDFLVVAIYTFLRLLKLEIRNNVTQFANNIPFEIRYFR